VGATLVRILVEQSCHLRLQRILHWTPPTPPPSPLPPSPAPPCYSTNYVCGGNGAPYGGNTDICCDNTQTCQFSLDLSEILPILRQQCAQCVNRDVQCNGGDCCDISDKCYLSCKVMSRLYTPRSRMWRCLCKHHRPLLW
jgi:hypothetical protein